MKTMEVTIAPDGQCKVETKGFAGAACQAASRFLLRVLGICSGQQLTSEYYRTTEHVMDRTQQQS